MAWDVSTLTDISTNKSAEFLISKFYAFANIDLSSTFTRIKGGNIAENLLSSCRTQVPDCQITDFKWVKTLNLLEREFSCRVWPHSDEGGLFDKSFTRVIKQKPEDDEHQK